MAGMWMLMPPLAQADEAANPPLPYVLRQAVAKAPATLYTVTPCSPCDSARAMLLQRGIPFDELTVNRSQDLKAFVSRFGDSSMPSLTLGGKRLTGFTPDDWNDYLDVAGYPSESALPPGYHQPTAHPLADADDGSASPSQRSGKVGGSPSDTDSRAPSAAPGGTTIPGFRF